MGAGYSKNSLSRKLGIKNGYIIKLINTPSHYFELFDDFPGDIMVANEPEIQKDFIHLFITNTQELEEYLRILKTEIKSNGMIWVSWPKKASKVRTDVNEDTIRSYALELGLVDIKVCAVDEVWSGLKLVIPVKERNK